MTKFPLLAALGAAVLLGACASSDRIPSSVADLAGLEQRAFELDPFERIEIDANVALEVRRADTQSVRIATETDHFVSLEVASSDGTLTIRHLKKHRRQRHTRVEIALPRLTALRISGVVSGDVSGIDSDDFDLKFGGVGELRLSGRCGNADYKVSGVGDVDLAELRCRHVRARVSGVGDVALYAGETIELKISGIGSITVRGHPEVLGFKQSGIGDVDFQ